MKNLDLSDGSAVICANVESSMFYKILAEKTKLDIENEEDLMSCIGELAETKNRMTELKMLLMRSRRRATELSCRLWMSCILKSPR